MAYQLTKRDKTYVDISLAFEPNPLTNDLTLLLNERAINNSVKNLILITPSEVPFNRDIGSTTREFLFDLIDDATIRLLEAEIKRAIIFGEPRVTFDNPVESELIDYEGNVVNRVYDDFYGPDALGVIVTTSPSENALEVVVKYRIVGGLQVFRVQQILYPTR